MPPSLNRRMSPSFNHSNHRNINEENVNLDETEPDETEITEEDSLFKSDYTEISMEPCGSANLKAMEVAKEAGALLSSFKALKSVGVEGVMVDVWWGLVEEVVGKYNWGGYAELFDMAKSYGLKVQAVMSCHQCGGTVGDSCLIPLPKWVVEEIDKDPDLAYTDQWGRRNYEYLSLGCDTIPCLKGRTPVQFNSDYMRAFKHKFSHLLGDTIMELQVGMVPAGELRYPSYPEKDGIWKFPGIEAFQCYEKFESRS